MDPHTLVTFKDLVSTVSRKGYERDLLLRYYKREGKGGRRLRGRRGWGRGKRNGVCVGRECTNKEVQ